MKYLHRHLTSATSPFQTLSAWPHGVMKVLPIPEVNLEKEGLVVVTKFGCHDQTLTEELSAFYAEHGIGVCEPRRTFINSHVYSCRLLSSHSHKLIAAYTATAFEDATTKAPVLYVQYLAKVPSDLTIGSASVGDFLFEHMRNACMRCKPEARTFHILVQSVGYHYDPGPILDTTHLGAQFWRNRLRITERGLDYMCFLAVTAEVALQEDCVTMHRVFASASSAAA